MLIALLAKLSACSGGQECLSIDHVTVDLGGVESGSQAVAPVVVHNNCGDTIECDQIGVSCSCALLECADKSNGVRSRAGRLLRFSVAPHGSVELVARINVGVGPSVTKLRLGYGGTRYVECNVQTTGVRYIRANPETIDLGSVVVGVPTHFESRLVTLDSAWLSPTNDVATESPTSRITWSIAKDGNEWKLMGQFTAKLVGCMSETISIKSTEQHACQVAIRGIAKGVVDVSPRIIELTDGGGGNSHVLIGHGSLYSEEQPEGEGALAAVVADVLPASSVPSVQMGRAESGARTIRVVVPTGSYVGPVSGAFRIQMNGRDTGCTIKYFGIAK
jgi:hypothetical protein